MTVKELKSILDQFDENMNVCMAKRSRKNPQYAHDVGIVEVLKLDPWLDYINPYKDVQDMVVIGISGEIGEAYKD